MLGSHVREAKFCLRWSGVFFFFSEISGFRPTLRLTRFKMSEIFSTGRKIQIKKIFLLQFNYESDCETGEATMIYKRTCIKCSCKMHLLFYMKLFVINNHLSRDMTKPTKWVCAQRGLRSAWTSAQSDQSLRCALSGQLKTLGFFMRTAKTLIRVWSESSLCA